MIGKSRGRLAGDIKRGRISGFTPSRGVLTASIIISIFIFSFFLLDSGCGRTGYRAGGGVVPESCTDYPRIVDQPGKVGQFSSLAFDQNNIPHIAYYDLSNHSLKYAQAVTSSSSCGWKIDLVDEQGQDAGLFPTIVIAEDNQPRVAYLSWSTDALQGIHYQIRFAQRIYNPEAPADQAYSWQTANLDDSGVRGLSTSMVLGPDRFFHLSTLNTQTKNLEYIYYDGTNASIETVLSLAGYNLEDVQTSVGVTPGAVPIIALHHPGAELWVAQRSSAPPTPGTWQITTVEPWQYTEDIGRYVHLAVDSLGLPHLCYFRWARAQSELWYNHFDGSSWERSIVDSEGLTGAACSIALDASGRPLISYLDSTNNDLKIAYLRDPARMRWDIWSVDYSLATGQWSDIKVAGSGNVGVSYYDFSIEGLKFYWIGFN